MTVGGKGPSRPGVLVPFAPGWDAGTLLNLSGTPWFCAAFMAPAWAGWPGTPGLAWSPDRTTLFGGRGLLRISLRVEVDEDGVRTGDWFASLDTGDWVPSLESLFFLEDLLESLPRESCATGVSTSAFVRAQTNRVDGQCLPAAGKGGKQPGQDRGRIRRRTNLQPSG